MKAPASDEAEEHDRATGGCEQPWPKPHGLEPRIKNPFLRRVLNEWSSGAGVSAPSLPLRMHNWSRSIGLSETALPIQSKWSDCKRTDAGLKFVTIAHVRYSHRHRHAGLAKCMGGPL